MDPAIWVALIGSVATVSGTLGGQALGARTERTRAEHEDTRELARGQREDELEHRRVNVARIDELRGVLDDAAQALTRALHAFNEADYRRPREADDVRYDEYVASLHELWKWETRLAVRLGDESPTFKAYAEAALAIGRPQLFFSGLRSPGADASPFGMDSEAHKTIQESRREAFAAQKRFHMLAAATIGPEVEHPDSSDPEQLPPAGGSQPPGSV